MGMGDTTHAGTAHSTFSGKKNPTEQIKVFLPPAKKEGRKRDSSVSFIVFICKRSKLTTDLNGLLFLFRHEVNNTARTSQL